MESLSPGLDRAARNYPGNAVPKIFINAEGVESNREGLINYVEVNATFYAIPMSVLAKVGHE